MDELSLETLLLLLQMLIHANVRMCLVNVNFHKFEATFIRPINQWLSI